MMLTIGGAGTKNVLLSVTLLRTGNSCIQHPGMSPACMVAWWGACRAMEAGLGMTTFHSALSDKHIGTALCKLTIKGVRVTC